MDHNGIELNPIIETAREAGGAIMAVYAETEAGGLEVTMKSDDSPVTRADMASHDIITARLRALHPDIPILSEEGGLPSFEQRKDWGRFWLVDPLDGTREFIARNGEFAVLIALIQERRPAAGVMYVPITDTTYYGAKGQGAFRVVGGGEPERLPLGPRGGADIGTRDGPKKLVVYHTRRPEGGRLEEYLEELRRKYDEVEEVAMGSAIKFGKVAEGTAHLCPGFQGSSEWDLAAGDLLVWESGGSFVFMETGEAPLYNKENLRNPWFIVRGAGLERMGK